MEPWPATRAAGDHGRNDDLLADPGLGPGAGLDDDAADLVAEGQRQGMAGGDTVVHEPEVCVTDAASGHLDQDLAGASGGLLPGGENHGGAGLTEHPGLDLHACSVRQRNRYNNTYLPESEPEASREGEARNGIEGRSCG